RSAGSSRAVMEQLDVLLRPFGSSSAYARADQPSEAIVSSEIKGQRVFGLVLPTVFLAVAVFILNVVISRQVTTQRDQIAALKALGYDDSSIIAYYLKLAALIIVIGLGVGLLVGKWYGELMTGLYAEVFRFAYFEHHISAWVWLAPFAVNLLAAIAGTLYATRSILSLSPAQAMRPPAPTVYRATLLERIGLGGRSSAAANMIFRHMERHPARTLLTMVGVAGAVGILISGTWWRDALDYLIDVQFSQVDRADVHLQFVDSIDARAVRSLRRLPGVIEADTQRIVAVKLHREQRNELTTISGLKPALKLRRLLDANGQQIRQPRNGLILDMRLAGKLRVGVGDDVRVEFLDRRAPDAEVQVTGLIEQMMASGAHMRADQLDNLAGNKNTVSWAGLMIDGTRLNEIYDAVKNTPKIAGIVVKAELIRHFRENTGRNILIFTTILTVFAGLIAVGVVYNSARISLAERAWEFATLRVLGMTEQEVSSLLIGELLIGLLVGIPTGWLFGWVLSWYLAGAMGHDEFAIPLIIWPRTYAYAAVTMLVAGLATALTVRRRLRHLDLIAVLKTRE
ncbi:MAG: ABC transporter permease, partial [Burkholderiaceae bacterium]